MTQPNSWSFESLERDKEVVIEFDLEAWLADLLVEKYFKETAGEDE